MTKVEKVKSLPFLSALVSLVAALVQSLAVAGTDSSLWWI